MTHGTGYTQIRRGPMGGDHYTQIHNGVFRDPTLTPNAKAVFGWISTHTQGWEISLAAIAAAMGMGKPATRAAVALLKRRHYLVYGQDRNPDGTVREGWYYYTDLPAQLAASGVTDDQLIARSVADTLEHWRRQNSRSAPGCGIGYPGDVDPSSQVSSGMRFTGYPAQPHAVPGPPKKTKVLEHQEPQEDHSSALALTHSSSKQASTAPKPYPHTDFEDLMEWVEDQVDGYGAGENNAAESMLDRGEPPAKVVNTLLKQRREGYSLARRSVASSSRPVSVSR